MKAAQYGLTRAGFMAKPLAVILEEEREAFGGDVDVGGESVAGAYVGNIAAKLAALWSQLEGVYLAGDRAAAAATPCHTDGVAAADAMAMRGRLGAFRDCAGVDDEPHVGTVADRPHYDGGIHYDGAETHRCGVWVEAPDNEEWTGRFV